ncbi:hypothetical protein SAMN05216326_101176 [Nitrosomonas marina]|uniref:Lipoprotein n=1 Tax=Nitrosomonas marina TaxID=917 RepID=A0A1H9YAW4_9PROT|nr:DUF6279 family lipoprotein [Nitrosomonas marina]SES66094.1 hypothetical protein SAMN05216326_101176 [Nitrosomonas marina]
MNKSIAIMMLSGLLLLSGGCSVVRLGYDHGASLAWWWLDSYVDFDRNQKPHVKQAIQDWFDWHRGAQLPVYVDWLSDVRSRIDGPLTSEQVCRWSEELQEMLAPAFDHGAQLGAPIALRLGEAQWKHLEKRYAKSNDKLRSEYLQPDPEDRLDAAVKRTIKRVENLYGAINKSQRALIISGLQASPFDPEAWLNERQRRQRSTLTVLRRIAAESVPASAAAAELRQLIERTHRSDDADYRSYQLRLSEHICSFIAHLHNNTTKAQREHAHDKLKKWENDLRVLSGSHQRTGKHFRIAAE